MTFAELVKWQHQPLEATDTCDDCGKQLEQRDGHWQHPVGSQARYDGCRHPAPRNHTVPAGRQIRHAHLAGTETLPARGGHDPACRLPAPHECRDDRGEPLTWIGDELSFTSWCHLWATGRAS